MRYIGTRIKIRVRSTRLDWIRRKALLTRFPRSVFNHSIRSEDNDCGQEIHG